MVVLHESLGFYHVFYGRFPFLDLSVHHTQFSTASNVLVTQSDPAKGQPGSSKSRPLLSFTPMNSWALLLFQTSSIFLLPLPLPGHFDLGY